MLSNHNERNPRAIETLSAPLLIALGKTPWLLPIVLGTVLLLGYFSSPPLQGYCFLFVGIILSWLSAVSWPQLSIGSKTIRLIVISIFIIATIKSF